MATCRRGSMVEVNGKAMTEDDYIEARGDGPTYPAGYEDDLDDLMNCPEDPSPF